MTPVRAMLHNAVGLALFAAVTVGVVALTAHFTGDRIAAQQERLRQAALLEVLAEDIDAADAARLDLSQTLTLRVPELGHRAPEQAVIARRDGVPVALLLPVIAADGYSGAIRLLLGVDPDGRVTGVRVLAHRETPGLGDAIERRRSDWIEGFRGRALGDPSRQRWAVRPDGGEFDAFTGATITPRAVVRAIARALDWFEDEGHALLAGEAT